jgi:hypothetical protein
MILFFSAPLLAGLFGCNDDSANDEGGPKNSTPYTCAADPSECLNALAGVYEGSYSGELEGTWRVTIGGDGAMQGTTTNAATGDEYTVTGTANDKGGIVFGTVSDGSAFKGRVYADFSVWGNWSLGDMSGTFQGRRVVVGGLDNGEVDVSADAGLDDIPTDRNTPPDTDSEISVSPQDDTPDVDELFAQFDCDSTDSTSCDYAVCDTDSVLADFLSSCTDVSDAYCDAGVQCFGDFVSCFAEYCPPGTSIEDSDTDSVYDCTVDFTDCTDEARLRSQ